MSAIVLQGDARQLPLPDASVDLIVTSPPLEPYFGLRSYTDGGEHYEGQIGSEATPQEWLAALVACTAEWMRVLKPEGSMFINLGDKYAGGGGQWENDDRPDPHRRRAVTGKIATHGNTYGSRPKCLLGLPWRYALAATDQLGLILRAEIIWAKPNGLPESVTDRVRRAHEQVFHLTQLPRYYSAVDEIREPQVRSHLQKHNAPEAERVNGGRRLVGQQGLHDYVNPLGKLPGSVWDIPSQPLTVPARLGVDHFAAFPMELPRRVILGWSPPGVCVACGQGRRPVTHTEYTKPIPGNDLNGRRSGNGDATWSFHVRREARATITGYVCACTPHTDHPGTGGRDRDGQAYARETGRDAHPHGGVGMLPRTGPWREYHHDAWTPPPTRPALVLDPFGGTGTTALVAAMHGRVGVSIDRSADYTRLATWRCNDPAERAKALQVPKPPPIPDGMEALF